MNKKFLVSSIALAFILVAVFTGFGSGSVQRKPSNSSAPPADVLNYLPAADGIALIDVRRLMNETMPRILGVDIPNDKPTHISLRYIYGVGPTVALRLCDQAKIDPQRRAKELTDDDISRLASILDREYTVEGALRRQVQQNITRLKDIASYRGFRHRRGLPVRGQRTKTNARTRKGPRKTVAGKKGVKELSK